MAEAEAARRTQERKLEAEKPLRERTERLLAEDEVAALFRAAFTLRHQ